MKACCCCSLRSAVRPSYGAILRLISRSDLIYSVIRTCMYIFFTIHSVAWHSLRLSSSVHPTVLPCSPRTQSFSDMHEIEQDGHMRPLEERNLDGRRHHLSWLLKRQRNGLAVPPYTHAQGHSRSTRPRTGLSLFGQVRRRADTYPAYPSFRHFEHRHSSELLPS